MTGFLKNRRIGREPCAQKKRGERGEREGMRGDHLQGVFGFTEKQSLSGLENKEKDGAAPDLLASLEGENNEVAGFLGLRRN